MSFLSISSFDIALEPVVEFWDDGFADESVCSIWGLADGSRKVNVDAEIVAYAVLDVLAKPVFGFWLLFTHDAMASS